MSFYFSTKNFDKQLPEFAKHQAVPDIWDGFMKGWKTMPFNM